LFISSHPGGNSTAPCIDRNIWRHEEIKRILGGGNSLGAVETEPPAHPYTRALIASVPKMTGPIGRLTTIEGQPPSLMNLRVGCRFASSCPQVEQRCLDAYPASVRVGDGHTADCWKATPG
jgi:oligopeptide/dipeptide ABC transporter ATP-binding protein